MHRAPFNKSECRNIGVIYSISAGNLFKLPRFLRDITEDSPLKMTVGDYAFESYLDGAGPGWLCRLQK